MDKQEIILMYFRDGKALRAIARETKIDRKTVRRYVNEYALKKKLLVAATGSDTPLIIESVVAPPTYDTSSRKATKVTDKVIERLKHYLEVNEKNLKLGMRKQLMKKVDIYSNMRSEGYDISYPSVCQTINKLIEKSKEAFIRATYALGDICEFDWGEVKLIIDGVLKVFQMAVFTSAAGNYRFAVLYPKQKTEFFQAAHAEFFTHIGGNYKTVVYDNMRVAVAKFVGTEKHPTEALLKLSMYYCFNFRFCNIYSGNEKGHVEKSVEYVRRKAFSAKTEFKSMDEANTHLCAVCEELNSLPQKLLEGKTANQILWEEKPFLLPILPPFEVSRLEYLRVNKYSCINFENCFYSVPDKYVDKLVEVRVYPKLILIVFKGEKVAQHDRLYGSYKWSMNIFHYLKTMSRKTGALHSSLVLAQMEEGFKTLYAQYFIDKPKDFIEILFCVRDKNITLSQLNDACVELTRKNLIITLDKLLVLISNKKHLPYPESETSILADRHLRAYSNMMEVACNA